MALSKEKIELIIALVKKGGLSNVAISKEVGCSESAVRTTIKNHDVKKNEITDLAKEEVQSIIIQDEIKKRKNELNEVEKTIYDEVLLTEVQSHNLALNTNHLLLQKINNNIESGKKQVVMKVKEYSKENGSSESLDSIDIEHDSSDFLNLAKAIQTTTDNLGITQRHAPKQDINVAQQNNTETKRVQIVRRNRND